MIKGGERYKTEERTVLQENSLPWSLGYPSKPRKGLKRPEIYHLSNNSFQAQFTGAVFIATCSHHISFKITVRNQFHSKYIKKKNHKTKTPKTKQLKHHHHKKPPVNKQRNRKAHHTTN